MISSSLLNMHLMWLSTRLFWDALLEVFDDFVEIKRFFAQLHAIPLEGMDLNCLDSKVFFESCNETAKIWVIICWFSSFWHHFDFVKQAKFATSGYFQENAREEWPELWHADVSWPPSELIKFWSWSVNFPFLASFWLSETGQIWGLWQFSSECMGGMACNLTCWCILTTFSTAYILVIVCWFSSFWQEFDLVKQVIFAVFKHFLENA